MAIPITVAMPEIIHGLYGDTSTGPCKAEIGCGVNRVEMGADCISVKSFSSSTHYFFRYVCFS